MVQNKKANIKFSGKAKYQIIVQGKLSENRFNSFGDLKVRASRSENDMDIVTLEGIVRDQTELSGILTNLYSLHLSVIKVQSIDEI